MTENINLTQRVKTCSVSTLSLSVISKPHSSAVLENCRGMRFLSLILKHCVCLPIWKVLLKVKWNSTYFSEKSVRNLWTSFTGAPHFSVESGK